MGGLGFFGLDLAHASTYAGDRAIRGPALATILIWLSGGASHIDTWDMKSEAPAEYRGSFKPVATGAPGISLCEHLPHLAPPGSIHLAVVRSEAVKKPPNCSVHGPDGDNAEEPTG